jgi:hypothetical protein
MSLRQCLSLRFPIPAGTADERLARVYDEARRALRAVPQDAIIEIVGLGFFDTLHGQRGMAPNGLEIHPVLRLTVVSIVLTSNKHVRDWPEIFAGDEILTTAILDRLLHHVHVIHIDGRSYRLRDLDSLLSQPTDAPPTQGGGTTKPN